MKKLAFVPWAVLGVILLTAAMPMPPRMLSHLGTGSMQVFTGVNRSWVIAAITGTTSAVRIYSSAATSVGGTPPSHTSIKITNNGAADCFVGPSTAGTPGATGLTGGTNGSRVAANGGIWSAEFGELVDVWYICPTGNQTAGTATAPTGTVLETAS